MKTLRLTMAQALVRFLNNQYIDIDGRCERFVEGVFTIFGHGNVLGLGQALEEDPGHLNVWQGRNEQGMAHAAIGFARQHLRQKIIACSASVGPGSANMLTAAGTATANRIPLLLLAGDVFASRQPDPVLQQIEQPYDLSLSTNDAFKPLSKYWDRIVRPEQLMSACINAMRVLTDPAETGTVTLCLPQDVQGEAYEYPESFFTKRVHTPGRRLPTAQELEQAITLLNASHSPLIICGGGVKYGQADKALLEFAEKFSIPFVETQAGKGTIPSSHPLNMGGVGETGSLAGNLLAQDADLVIGIGTRYTDFTTSSKWIFKHPDVKFLNINVSRFDSYKLDGIQVVADAKVALESLSEKITALTHSWQTAPVNAKNRFTHELQRLYHPDTELEIPQPEVKDSMDTDSLFKEVQKIHGTTLLQTHALGIINQYIPQKNVIVAAAGSLPGDLQRLWQSPGHNSYHVEYGYSCMGYEVNAALGVKLAAPDHEVYALLGDGSFMMLHSELVTSLQMGKKINVLLFDNMANGCINNLQMGQGMGSFCTEFRYHHESSFFPQGELIPINYAKIAEGYGCKAYEVKNEQELIAALKDAESQTGSILIDIKVLPKTMAHGYMSWWHVGTARVSSNPAIQEAALKLEQQLTRARRY